MTLSKRQQREIAEAVAVLRDGGLVAFPTETYYGLAVDPFNEQALERLFTVKNRVRLKPVLVLLAEREQLGLLAAKIPEIAHPLMDRFWPGPLTLVFPARPELPALLTGGTASVGVRLSPHPLAAGLVRAFGAPLTATSANRSGEAAAVTGAEVRRLFGAEVDLVLDGGVTPGRTGSTLVAVTRQGIRRIRAGRIAFREVERLVSAT